MLSIQQIDRVTLEAWELWPSFVAASASLPVKHTSRTLLNPLDLKSGLGVPIPPNSRIQNPTAEAFFRYCSDKLVGEQKVLLPAIIQPVPIVHGQLPTTSPDVNNSRSRWIIDNALIEIQIVHCANYGLGWLDARRVYTKLLLHEIGHYVMHSNNLIDAAQRTDKPPIATPVEEAEAWLFAHIVFGIASADVADADRQNGLIGNVWRWV